MGHKEDTENIEDDSSDPYFLAEGPHLEKTIKYYNDVNYYYMIMPDLGMINGLTSIPG